MRRPVRVKCVFVFPFPLSCLWIPGIRVGPPLSPSFHPHSLLSDFRSVPGGRSQCSRCCNLIIDLGSRHSTEAGPGVRRSHLISAVGLGCSDSTLRHCPPHFVVVPQWFIDLPTSPQLMKQHCQLPSHSNHGSFLGILSSSLGQLQSPAPQVTVLSKGPENVVCALHHQRP